MNNNTQLGYSLDTEIAIARGKQTDLMIEMTFFVIVFLIAAWLIFKQLYTFWFNHQINKTIITKAQVEQYLVSADNKGLLPIHGSNLVTVDIDKFLVHYNEYAKTKRLPDGLHSLSNHNHHAPHTVTNNHSDNDVNVNGNGNKGIPSPQNPMLSKPKVNLLPVGNNQTVNDVIDIVLESEKTT